MQIDPRPATTKNPPEMFTGDVWLDPIARPREDGQRMFVAKVRFAPGARTAWHSHARGQTLHMHQRGGVGAGPGRGEDRGATPARPSTAHRARSTGTAPRPTPSWSTSP